MAEIIKNKIKSNENADEKRMFSYLSDDEFSELMN